jgi:hypothetical protein
MDGKSLATRQELYSRTPFRARMQGFRIADCTAMERNASLDSTLSVNEKRPALNGWAVSITAILSKHSGVTADFGGLYWSKCAGLCARAFKTGPPYLCVSVCSQPGVSLAPEDNTVSARSIRSLADSHGCLGPRRKHSKHFVFRDFRSGHIAGKSASGRLGRIYFLPLA